MQRIPIDNAPRQSFTIGAADRYRVLLVWNTVARAWFATIDVFGVRYLTGARVTLGVNLLRGVATDVLVAVNASNTDTSIEFDNLINGDVRLYLIDESELL